MPDQPKYPFVLQGAFFVRLEFRRQPEIEGPLKTVWSATIRVDDSSYPKFDVGILAGASSDQPFSFTVELLGRYDIEQGVTAPERTTLPEFLSEQGLFMLWPYVVQAVAQASSQMGMPPVHIETPTRWQVSPSPSPSASPSPAPPDE
jgi:preprotein translocase subunit SecB